MLCDLGVYHEYRHQVSDALQKTMDSVDWSQVAQQSFSRCFEMGSMQCHGCNADVQSLDFEQDTSLMHFAQCLRCFCSNCAKSARMDGSMVKCGHDVPCPISPVSIDSPADDALPISTSINAHQPIVLSTKVARLIGQIQDLAPGVKR